MVNLWDRAAHKLEASLVDSGRPAKATVLEARQAATRLQEAVGFKPGELFVAWLAALRVEPESEPAFELRLKIDVRDTITLVSGFTLQVLYDPADPTRMTVDPKTVPRTTDDALAWFARAQAEAEGFDLTGLEGATGPEIDEAVRRTRNEAVNRSMAESLKARREGAQGPTTTPPAQFRVDIATKIEQLDRLQAAGLIDDAQYQTKKQQLIDRR